MPVPNTFANATATIPLSQLDANFATTITLGNTAIQLGNTVSTLNNMTLANVTVTSGNVTITNVTVTTANVTTANIATAEIANVTVSGTGTFAAGSNTAPSITTSGDTNTGIFFPAADTIAFTEGGVESMRIDSSGNVGIGTTGNLNYSSRLKVLAPSNGSVAEFYTPGNTYKSRINLTNDFGGAGIGSDSSALVFYANDATTERMRLDSSGNLGLGVTPSAWPGQSASYFVAQFGRTAVYDVAGTAGRMSYNAFIDSGGTNKYIANGFATRYDQGSGTHEWRIAASGTAGNAITFTQAMTLDASGNLGIGTTTPAANSLSLSSKDVISTYSQTDSNSGAGKFIFNKPNFTSGSQFVESFVAKNNATTHLIGGVGTDSGGNIYTAVGNASNTPLTFRTNATERARITSDGYFKATSTGTYSAGTTGAVHEFNTSSVNGTIVNFYNQAASTPNGIYVQYTAADPNDATRYVFGSQQNTGVWIYRIYSNGTVAARSDVKWKKNIETARDGYAEDLAKLRVVKYNWYNHEDGTPKELGLIAQEVEQVFPGLVTTDEQTRNEIKTREIPAVLDEEGNEVEPARTEEYTEKVGTGEYSKSIKFSVLPIMLLKAIQEQQAMIEELKAKVAALENA